MESLINFRKRAKNNEAVKKSRAKTKQQTEEMTKKLEELKNENQELESNIVTLSKELILLKQLFIDHAGKFDCQLKLYPRSFSIFQTTSF